MSVNLLQAKSMILDVLKAGLVPMVTSSPGMGKTSIVQKIAEENSLEYLDIRMSYRDPVDLGGLITTNSNKTKASYIPFDIFPVENDPIPAGKKGWLLNLDEFNSAPAAVQAACYKLVLDKAVGEFKLHPNVAIACTGNLATDNAIVEELSTAMQSRLIHIQIHSDLDVWSSWAVKNKIDPRIIGYLGWQPQNLNNFNPEHSDLTFACERTWEFASKLIIGKKLNTYEIKELLAGTVGKGTALEFVAYSDIYAKLPTKDDIINNSSYTIPTEPSTLYAFSSMLMHYIVSDSSPNQALVIDRLINCCKKLPIDFQVLIFKHVFNNSKLFNQHQCIMAWSKEMSQHLI